MNPDIFRNAAEVLDSEAYIAVSDKQTFPELVCNELDYLFRLKDEAYRNQEWANSFYTEYNNNFAVLLCLMVAEGIEQGLLP